MMCPVCKRKEGLTVQLETGLEALKCEKCGGHWISAARYDAWRTRHTEQVPEKRDVVVTLDIQEEKKAKLCADCGRILVKFKVGHGLSFSVEHCGGCGGIWLDKNEWEALRAKGLHDNLHMIFSSPWQDQIRSDEVRKVMEAAYAKRFGKEAFEKAQSIREWIHGQKEKRALLAFVTDEDPFFLARK